MPVDVAALDCDFYVFSGHKLYGPTGIGVLWGRADLLDAMPPYQGGGSMIDRVTFAKTTYAPPPGRFEAGTPHIVGVVGLHAAIDYVESIGLDRIHAHETALVAATRERLGQINSVRLFGPDDAAGIVSFGVEGVHPHDVATILDEGQVAIRAGHHCAQPLMDALGVPATARASFGVFADARIFEMVDSGIIQSRIASDGASFFRKAAIASVPFCVTTTSYPHFVSRAQMISRETASSSATRILVFGSTAFPAPGLGSGGSESGQGSVNFSSFALEGGEGAVGVFIIFIVRLRFELLGEVAGVVRTECSQGAEQRMRGAGEVGGVAARDGAADVVEKARRVFVEERDHPPHQRLVAIELIEELFPGEDGTEPVLPAFWSAVCRLSLSECSGGAGKLRADGAFQTIQGLAQFGNWRDIRRRCCLAGRGSPREQFGFSQGLGKSRQTDAAAFFEEPQPLWGGLLTRRGCGRSARASGGRS